MEAFVYIIFLGIFGILFYTIVTTIQQFGLNKRYVEEAKFRKEAEIENELRNAKKNLSVAQASQIALAAIKRYDFKTVSKLIQILENDQAVQDVIDEFHAKLIPVYEELMANSGLKKHLIGNDQWELQLEYCLSFGRRALQQHDFNLVESVNQQNFSDQHRNQEPANLSETYTETVTDISRSNTNLSTFNNASPINDKKQRRWGIFTVAVIMTLYHLVEAAATESIASPYTAFWIYAAYLAIKDDIETLSSWLYALIILNSLAVMVLLFVEFDNLYFDMSKEEMLTGIVIAIIVKALLYGRTKTLLRQREN